MSTRLERWEARTDTPLLVAAAAFLVAYATPIVHPQLPGWAGTTCRVGSNVVWVLFATDLSVRLVLSERRGRYLLTNWLDVVAVAVPMLRPLRVLRAVIALSIVTRRGQRFARGRVVVFVAGAAGVMCGVAALAVLDAERRSPDANITGIGDAIWWSISTVTTVGYGDRYPTTGEGRLVAVALMLTGIALLGVITAALASWFVERISEVQQAEERAVSTLDELTQEVRDLREQIAVLLGSNGHATSASSMAELRQARADGVHPASPVPHGVNPP